MSFSTGPTVSAVPNRQIHGTCFRQTIRSILDRQGEKTLPKAFTLRGLRGNLKTVIDPQYLVCHQSSPEVDH
jgi:hypothetical protein